MGTRVERRTVVAGAGIGVIAVAAVAVLLVPAPEPPAYRSPPGLESELSRVTARASVQAAVPPTTVVPAAPAATPTPTDSRRATGTARRAARPSGTAAG
jgi:hypothetical protein